MKHTGKGIEIITNSPGGRVLIQPEGVLISSTGKPVSSISAITGTVYLVLDCSGSMSGNKIEQAKQGAINFAQDALRRGYSVGLIRFDSSAELVCKAVREISPLRQAVNILEGGDTTEMVKAINLAHANLKDQRGNRVIVVVTDGMPNGSGDPEASLKEAECAKKEGIGIITIGTDDADRQFLKKLASLESLGTWVSSNNLKWAITESARLLPTAGHLKGRI